MGGEFTNRNFLKQAKVYTRREASMVWSLVWQVDELTMCEAEWKKWRWECVGW